MKANTGILLLVILVVVLMESAESRKPFRRFPYPDYEEEDYEAHNNRPVHVDKPGCKKHNQPCGKSSDCCGEATICSKATGKNLCFQG
jgi:hypothetical protein